MADDPKAKQFTLNYTGGSITSTAGVFESLFGEGSTIINPVPATETVTVKSHSRVRIIGQPASQVSGYSYENIQWPTSQAGNAAAGKLILMSWEGSEGDWSAMVSGSFSGLGVFLAANSPKTVEFRSERGTKYGPYKQSS
jgi:hypothetical protein